MRDYIVCPTCEAYIDPTGVVYTSYCAKLIRDVNTDSFLTDQEKKIKLESIQNKFVMTRDQFTSKVCDLRHNKLNQRCSLQEHGRS